MTTMTLTEADVQALAAQVFEAQACEGWLETARREGLDASLSTFNVVEEAFDLGLLPDVDEASWPDDLGRYRWRCVASVVEREKYPDADAAEGALEMPTPEVELWF